MPAAFHPTATPTEKSVGIAIGGVYQKQSDLNQINFPYGEGWLRVPVAPGQLGVHISPSWAHLSYRYDVLPLGESIGFAIEPLIGLSYIRAEIPQGMTTQEEEAFSFMGGIAPQVLIPVGSNFAYVIPKFAIQHVRDLNAGAMMDDSDTNYMLGISAGIYVGNGLSFELAVHGVENLDNGMTPEAWLIAPTIGIRH